MESHTRTLILRLVTTAALVASTIVTVITPNYVTANQSVTSSGSGVYIPPTQNFTTPTYEAAPITRDSYTVFVPKPKPIVTVDMVKNVNPSIFTNNIEWDIQWPFPVGVPIASPFGERVKPCEICSSDHKGVDFTPGEGSVPQAIYDGVVEDVIDLGDVSYGYHVVINHRINGQKVQIVYGHLQVGSTTLKKGDKVRVGDPIGKVGSTGASTGAHLHFEVRVDGTPVDPMVWMPKNVGFLNTP